MAAIKGTQIDGDLSVGRNVAAGGNANVQGNIRVGHNLKVEGWLEAPNIKGVNKGIFQTLAELQAAYPDPKDGWFAGVGTSTPFAAYAVVDGEWVSTGGTIDVDVDLAHYDALLDEHGLAIDDLRSSLYEEVYTDITISMQKEYGKFIKSTGAIDSNSVYDLLYVEVVPGENYVVSATNTPDSSSARAWAFYSATDPLLWGPSTKVGDVGGVISRENYSDDVTVPTGAVCLVIQDYNLAAAHFTPSVKKVTFTSRFNGIEEEIQEAQYTKVVGDVDFGNNVVSGSYVGSSGNIVTGQPEGYKVMYIACSKGDLFRIVQNAAIATQAIQYAVYSTDVYANFSSSTAIEVGNVISSAGTFDIEVTSDSSVSIAFTGSSTRIKVYKIEKVETELLNMFYNKCFKPIANVEYNSDEVISEYDCMWEDGIQGHVTMTNYNGDVLEYAGATVTYGDYTITYNPCQFDEYGNIVKDNGFTITEN